ncbi:MAG TPA: YkgJ family cysteine cluster protein [Candidatus Aphodovivens avistercoris]|nr:YkgJ family cysteine cluster protein [Candidatus Aphodovivens avistercoris]
MSAGEAAEAQPQPQDGRRDAGSADAAGAAASASAASSAQPAAADKGADFPLHFDGENSYPECERCGRCCQVNVLAMTHEEVARIRAYMVERGIRPIDRHRESCCLEAADGAGCMVWPVRAQVCRLHNCHVSRIEILRRNPSIHVPDDIPLVDLHECFINGREIDPRYECVPQG